MKMLNLSKLLIVAAACLVGVQVAQCESLVFEEVSLPCHRLPINVRPTAYETYFKFPSLDSDEYEGHVNITIKILANQPTKQIRKGSREENDIAKSLRNTDCSVEGEPNQIVLHADERLDIRDIKVRSEPHLGFLFNGALKSRETVKLLRDRKKQMIAIRLKRRLYPNSMGRITIDFKGKMRDDKRGLYVSTYKDGQQVYKHIVSQFQPTDARTVFPCFDEPRFKVPFEVKLKHPEGLVAYGNTQTESIVRDKDEPLVTTTFATTPNMPVHMVAFTVGEFDEPLETVSAYYSNGSPSVRTIRVITAPGKRHTGHFALEVAKKSLEWFERYIDFKFPLDKLDVIAIADHDKDNTETWGLVFIRDNLVWIDDETKPDTKITTAVNVAHVVVHQWFANLVSAAWWTDLWITEGVAAQFSFRIVRHLYDFQSELFLRLATLTGVMQADQAGSLHSLSPPQWLMQTTDQIYGIFDNLEFMKSASLAQLVADAVGASWYQKTLRRLVASHAYSTVNYPDYVRALTNQGERNFDEVIKMIRTFATYKGVPLLNVVTTEVPSNIVRLTLEPFDQARKEVTDVVTYQTHDLALLTSITVSATTIEVYVHCQRDKLLTEKFIVPIRYQYVLDESFVQISAFPTLATYYRTRYTDQLYERLRMAIKKRKVLPIGRLQILDDANNLVQAQLIKNDTFKSLLDSYENEDDAAVIIQMLAASKTLSALQTSDTTPSPSSRAFLNLFRKYSFEVSGRETFIKQRARQVTLTALIKQGNQEVIEAALKAYEEAEAKVALFLREPVYTAIVVSGSSHVDELISKLNETKSYEERMRLIAALSLSEEKRVLEQLQLWLHSADLKADTVAPFLETVSAKLAH